MAVLLWAPRTLIVFCSMLVLSGVALADNRLCIGTDNIINALYINGDDVTSQLPNRGRARRPDCIQIPMETQTIAIKAMNLKDEAGISYCRNNPAVIYKDWKCLHYKKVQGENWYANDYVSAMPWKKARWSNYLHKRRWEKWSKLPCVAISKGPGRRYFWAVKTLSYQTIVCRISFCRSGCKSCKMAGPGKCDPGECTLGASTVDGVTDCNNKCCFYMKAWANADTDKTGYAKVINKVTGNTDEWPMNDDGRYIGVIDMNTCTFVNKTFSIPESVDPTSYQAQTNTFNRYRNSGLSPDLANAYGFEMTVGSSFAPWIGLWEFGTDKVAAEFGGTGKSRTFSACLTGRQNGILSLSDRNGPNL